MSHQSEPINSEVTLARMAGTTFRRHEKGKRHVHFEFDQALGYQFLSVRRCPALRGAPKFSTNPHRRRHYLKTEPSEPAKYESTGANDVEYRARNVGRKFPRHGGRLDNQPQCAG